MPTTYTFHVHNSEPCGPKGDTGEHPNHHLDLVDVKSLPPALQSHAGLAKVARLPLDAIVWAIMQSPLLKGLKVGSRVTITVEEPAAPFLPAAPPAK